MSLHGAGSRRERQGDAPVIRKLLLFALLILAAAGAFTAPVLHRAQAAVSIEMADYTLREPTPEFVSFFGRSVATGDVNGDGKEDVIVGALSAFVPVGDQLLVAGEAFVFLGGQTFDANADFTLRAPVPQDNQWFGQSVAAGDVNGDGKDDVIVGAPHPVCIGPIEDLVCFRGDAFVFLGGDPFDNTPDFSLTDPTPNGLGDDGREGFFGQAVTTGDVNGDGKEDVIVGAPSGSSPCCFAQGEAFVFLGANPFDATSDFALHGPSDVDMFGGQFGDELAAGDVNGDLKDDIVVGAPLAGPAFQGRAFAFLGGEPFDPVSDFTLQDPVLDDFANFGRAVAAGDLTGDGKSEVIVGSQAGGGTLVFLGGAPFDAISDHTLGQGAFSLTTGDVNGDLTDDLLVGQNTETVAGQSAAGRALLFLGASPFDISADFTLLDPNPEFRARFGHSLAAGDVNGDGVDDIVVGADASDVGTENDAGEAFVFLGESTVDTDGDTVPDSIDNCPSVANPAQQNTDAAPLAAYAPPPNEFDDTIAMGDALGDACDSDDDNDYLSDTTETGGAPCDSASSATNPLLQDHDGDRWIDGAECAIGTNPASFASKPTSLGQGNPSICPETADHDDDGDRLKNSFELLLGTNQCDADSDDDGILDGTEHFGYGTSPFALDSDLDGLKDCREIGDVNGNETVNAQDLGLVAAQNGRADRPVQDVDKNGIVNAADLGTVARAFPPGLGGTCAP